MTSELEGKPDAAWHSTGSRLRDVSAQLRGLLERGCHVVSTCEELAFPLDATIREELTQVARSKQVTLLGPGVNPGCQEVKSVESIRIQNASPAANRYSAKSAPAGPSNSSKTPSRPAASSTWASASP